MMTLQTLVYGIFEHHFYRLIVIVAALVLGDEELRAEVARPVLGHLRVHVGLRRRGAPIPVCPPRDGLKIAGASLVVPENGIVHLRL